MTLISLNVSQLSIEKRNYLEIENKIKLKQTLILDFHGGYGQAIVK